MEEAEGDKLRQQAFCEIASEDLEWWLATFVWTYRPQARFEIKKWPFIPYSYQRDGARKIYEAINTGHDLGLEKSRGTGASWLTLMTFLWYWLFSSEPVPFQCVSREEDLVDERGNPDSLFWKVDYAIANLPSWMGPMPDQVKRKHLQIRHPVTGSVMSGLSTTGDMAAGGRGLAMLLDEFGRVEQDTEALAATADVVDSRIFVSTAQGQGNEFYSLREGDRTPFLRWHWSQHPEFSRGLYEVDDDGNIELLDDFEGEVSIWQGEEGGWKTYQYPDDYPFLSAVPEGLRYEYQRRSPWFDSQCWRRQSRREIAQELQIDYLASGEAFFDEDVLTRVKERDCRPCFHKGQIEYDYDPETHSVRFRRFIDHPQGELRLWLTLDDAGKPPRTQNYVISCDISQGVGASNSVAKIYNTDGHEVAEWAAAYAGPEEFARVVGALAQWFRGQNGRPYLIWEMNGPGLNFGKQMKRMGFGAYVYYNRDELSDHPRKGNRPGWHSSPKQKRLLFQEYRGKLARGDILPRSYEAMEEAEKYVTTNRGGVETSKMADESTGARTNHGDRVVADALAARGIECQADVKLPEETRVPPPGSWEARRQLARRQQSQDDYWSP